MSVTGADAVLAEQRVTCRRVGADFEHCVPGLKVGISRELLSNPHGAPLHGLRTRPSPTTTGWYLWSGEMSDVPDFFVPIHLVHIWHSHAHILPYLGMARGWRFLIAPEYEDIWFDSRTASLDG